MKKTDIYVLEIIENIFYIGTCKLYSSIQDGGQRSIMHTNDLLNILDKKGINKPDINHFKNLSIHVNGGWGAKFNMSKLLSKYNMA